MNKLTIAQIKPLRTWNLLAGMLHFTSLVAVLALSNSFALPVTATYMTGPPGSSFASPVQLFSNNVSFTIALFLGLSALFHFLV